jgi:ketosteroid isomerase-like protein
MSEENVEIVRRIWELYDEGTLAAVEATFDQGLVAIDSTFTPAKEMPSASSYEGREGFMEFIRGWAAEFSDWTVRVEQIIDAGGDRVVVVLQQYGLGRTSGVPVDTRFATLYTLSKGQVIDRRDYTRPSDALEAAGLSE